MDTTTDALSIPKSFPIRLESLQPPPSTSAVQLEASPPTLEMKDRNSSRIIEPTAVPIMLSPRPKGLHLRASIQLASVCYSMFLAGWNDGTTGPLLPRIQKVYNVCKFYSLPLYTVTVWFQVGFGVVSLVFVLACIVGICSGQLDASNLIFFTGLHIGR